MHNTFFLIYIKIFLGASKDMNKEISIAAESGTSAFHQTIYQFLYNLEKMKTVL